MRTQETAPESFEEGATMQDADGIILQQIADIGCSLDDEIKSLKQFDSDIVYRVCVHYLKYLDAAKYESLPDVLSRSMSARANSCSALVNSIKDAGYRAEIGFHQFLYPNENDTRKLLIWFAQKGGSNKPITDGPIGADSALIGESIIKKLQVIGKEAWVPTRHHPTLALTTTPLIIPSRPPKSNAALAKFYSSYLPPVTRQPARVESTPASLFEHNLAAFSAAQERENEWNTLGLDSGVSPEEYKKKKTEGIDTRMANYLRAVVSADMGGGGDKQKDTLADMLDSFEQTFQQGQGQFARKKIFTNEVDAPQIVVKKETEEEKLQKQEAEIEELQKELSRLQQEASQLEQETQSLVGQIRQYESRLGEEDTRRQALEKEYKIKKKTAVLMEKADENIAELEEMSKAASQRLQDLAVKWEEHRVPLIEQYRALKDAQLNKEDDTKLALEQIKTMRAQMKAWVADIHQKDDHFKQLQDALDALPKDMTRAVYTRNILEIVKNVKKQKLDIDKILIDTRNLQKEINTVSDTLGRVFAVVDELVFADANAKDATAVQAYKHIAGIDKSFKKLVSMIEETGQTRNNVLNLDAKIEQIQLRTNSLNTERVEKDLAEVREENQTLQAKLKKQGVA